MKTIIFNDRTSDVQEIELDILEEPMRIVDYSDKSFAVYGSTREFMTELTRLGGQFARHLKDGPGWIFSNKHYEKVSDFVKKQNPLFNIQVLSITSSPLAPFPAPKRGSCCAAGAICCPLPLPGCCSGTRMPSPLTR